MTMQNSSSTKGTFFYGWVIVALCFFLYFMMYGLCNNTLSLYVVPVTQDLQIGRGPYSFLFSVKFMVQCAVTLPFGWLAAHMGLKTMERLGFIALSLGCLVMSMAQGLFTIYCSAMLLGLGMSVASLNVGTVMVRNWFAKHQGLLVGIVLSSTGIGGAVFSKAVGWWIAHYGWRMSYRIGAGVLFVMSMILISFLRDRPEECGQTAFGAESVSNGQTAHAETGITLKQALKMPYFYMCFALTVCFGVLNNPIHISAPGHLTATGFTLDFAVSINSAIFFSLAFVKILMGFAYDRWGVKVATLCCMAANLASLLLLCLLKEAWQAWLFAFVFAFSMPMETLTTPLLVASLFGKKCYKVFLGVLGAGGSVGIALGNPLLNFIYDCTGSYRTGYACFAVLSVLMTVTFLVVVRKAEQMAREKII